MTAKLHVKISTNAMLISSYLMDSINAPNLPGVRIPKVPMLVSVTKAMKLWTTAEHALILMNAKKQMFMHINVRMKSPT